MSNRNGPNDDGDEQDRWEPVDSNPAEEKERSQRLDEMEQRLKQKERELNKREQNLEEREQEILERREDIVEIREELEKREAETEQLSESLDDRETAIEEREKELERRAEELNQKEQAISDYVDDRLDELELSLSETMNGLESSITESVNRSVTEAVKNHGGSGSASRFGAIGGVLLGLIGMVLVVAGVANGFLEVAELSLPPLLSSSAGNFGASAVLIFSGLAANLAAAAGRV
jgi:ribonuclease Y